MHFWHSDLCRLGCNWGSTAPCLPIKKHRGAWNLLQVPGGSPCSFVSETGFAMEYTTSTCSTPPPRQLQNSLNESDGSEPLGTGAGGWFSKCRWASAEPPSGLQLSTAQPRLGPHRHVLTALLMLQGVWMHDSTRTTDKRCRRAVLSEVSSAWYSLTAACQCLARHATILCPFRSGPAVGLLIACCVPAASVHQVMAVAVTNSTSPASGNRCSPAVNK